MKQISPTQTKEKGNLILIQLKITLPLVLDLIPGTVKWRFVSERQLVKDSSMALKTSSLRSPLIKASKDTLRWVRLAFAGEEEEAAESILSLVLPPQKEAEEREETAIGSLTAGVLAGPTPDIGRAIFFSRCVAAAACSFGRKVGDFIRLRRDRARFEQGSDPPGFQMGPSRSMAMPQWASYETLRALGEI